MAAFQNRGSNAPESPCCRSSVRAVGEFVTGVKDGGRACAAGVLPLGFRRQAIGAALLFGEPLAEFDRLVPTDAAQSFVVVPFAGAERRKDFAVLAERQFRGRHVYGAVIETWCVGPFVPVGVVAPLGMASEICNRSPGRLAHRERASRNRHQLHADRIDDRLFGLCRKGTTCKTTAAVNTCAAQRRSERRNIGKRSWGGTRRASPTAKRSLKLQPVKLLRRAAVDRIPLARAELGQAFFPTPETHGSYEPASSQTGQSLPYIRRSGPKSSSA